MDARTRIIAGSTVVIGLFIAIQLGALALVTPFADAGVEPVEDPTDPAYGLAFFAAVLVGTGLMLAAMRYSREWTIHAVVLLACGAITYVVIDVLLGQFVPVSEGILGSGIHLGIPVFGALLLVGALYYYPEWYVIDGAGVIIGAGAGALFGLSLGPFPAILLLTILAVYDAISVYKTKHMLTLAEGVMDLKIPVILVVPTTRSFQFRTQGVDSTPAPEVGDTDGRSLDDSPQQMQDEDTQEREAIFIGLGDAIIPTILIGSAGAMHVEAPVLDVPAIVLTIPAAGAIVGTIIGLVGLLILVFRGRAHAGLPLLNGGAILGYLLSSVAIGIPLVEAIGWPL